MLLKKRNTFISICVLFVFFFIFIWKQRLLQKAHINNSKVKACYVVLIRNSELEGILSTMEQIEDTFNKKFNYPYVFLNNEAFTQEFIDGVKSKTSSEVKFGELDSTMWGYPDYINQTYAADCRKHMEEQGVPYALSESYRHMCR